MVTKEIPVYLFTGPNAVDSEGSSLKDSALLKIKEKYLNKNLQDFNLDVLYARDLSLKLLQEKLKSLPVKSDKRIIVIKGLEAAKDELREYVLKYVSHPYPAIILVLDIDHFDQTDQFVKNLSQHASVVRFKQETRQDAFSLCRQIDLRNADSALSVLNELFKNGEKPERIMGGLRYAWERDAARSPEARRRLKILLNCDIDIKTGKLKPAFALERLVIRLCYLKKPL